MTSRSAKIRLQFLSYSLGQAMSVLHSSSVVGLTECMHRTAETDTSIPCEFSLMHLRVRVIMPPSQDREHWKRDRLMLVWKRNPTIILTIVSEHQKNGSTRNIATLFNTLAGQAVLATQLIRGLTTLFIYPFIHKKTPFVSMLMISIVHLLDNWF